MSEGDLKRLIESSAVETRRAFDATAERLTAESRHFFDVSAEAVKHEVRIVAEAVGQVDGKLDREAAGIRDEMRRGFAETQAMIKFSHAELDRRVGRLEQALADLQARVERLESTTH